MCQSNTKLAFVCAALYILLNPLSLWIEGIKVRLTHTILMLCPCPSSVIFILGMSSMDEFSPSMYDIHGWHFHPWMRFFHTWMTSTDVVLPSMDGIVICQGDKVQGFSTKGLHQAHLSTETWTFDLLKAFRFEIFQIFRIGAVENGGQGGAIAPPVFREFYLLSQKIGPKTSKIGSFKMFCPPSFCIAPSGFRTLYRPCIWLHFNLHLLILFWPIDFKNSRA